MRLEDAMKKFKESALRSGVKVTVKFGDDKPPVASIGPVVLHKMTDEELDRAETHDPDKERPTPEQKEERKAKGFSTGASYATKEVKDWSSKDLWNYFRFKYEEAVKYRYGGWTLKEASQMKRLIQEYGIVDAKKAVEYVTENYRTIKVLKGSRPTVAFLFGFRKTLVAEAVQGKISKEITQEARKTEDEATSW